jgi:hypothetical protein
MSREQLAQTSAAEAFPCAQNGQVIDMAIRVRPLEQSLYCRGDHPNP